MICSHRLLSSQLPLCGAILCAILAGLSPAPAVAQDDDGHTYVMPNGRVFEMVKSDTEYAITFRPAADTKAAAARLKSLGRGEVSDLRGMNNDRIKLLKVDPATAVRRDYFGSDPAIESIRPIYRFAGIDRPIVSTGEIVMKLANAAQLDSVLAEYELELIEAVDGLDHVYRVKPTRDSADEVKLAGRLAGDARTKWAQPNLRRPTKRRQVTAEDEYYDRQWHLENTGQLGGHQDADIDASDAWVLAEGQGILIGMFDDGCDVDHEDLEDNYIGVGHDALLESNDEDYENPRPKRVGDLHGTAVMGVAVARPNEAGGRGVAYLANFTVSGGFGDGITDAEIASAFTFARQQGVDVHINSWGLTGPNPAIVVDAIETAFVEGRDVDGEGGIDALGMIVVFASGNDALEVDPDMDLSMLPQVLGVGASNDLDELASYSSYGTGLNFVAPSGDDFRGLITTTDNTDNVLPEDGYNRSGMDEQTGEASFDDQGLYTEVAGTSFACPIAAGVAALVLSRNQDLTATNVRILMEHTCDKIDEEAADYHGITQRSLTHGYGRVNAYQAVLAAEQFIDDDGRTWPGRVAAVEVDDDVIDFQSNIGTDEFLIVESAAPFDFVPEDNACYDCGQAGCSPAGECRPLADLPTGVTAHIIDCDGECEPGDAMEYEFGDNVGFRYYAIYARNELGRYSFGVAVNTGGEVEGDAPAIDTTGGDEPSVTDVQPPDVTISVSQTQGTSPLTVRFVGNATSDVEIDEDRIEWDFDTSDAQTIDSTQRNTTHTYTVDAGEIKTFTAKLTMYDVDGRSGTASVQVRVTGPEAVDGNTGAGSEDLHIVVGVPGSVDSDLDEGTSPFEVLLSIESDESLTGTVQSVAWDLGDGNSATSQVVPHTYVNDSDADLVVVITATITLETTGGALVMLDAQRVVTIKPGEPETESPEPDLPWARVPGAGGAANPFCGSVGMIPLLLMLGTVTWWRRR